MSKPKIVIALGGNALQSKESEATAEAQLKIVRSTCEYIAEISGRGYEMAVVHGNGPQVGRIILASETAKDEVPPMPFDVCSAMSQGYIGYHLQQALKYALNKRNRNVSVVTVATQMIVEPNDPAFQTPNKPIGPFYSEEEAKNLEQEKGYQVKEDAGRGWRKVVASPKPVDIKEINTIRTLLNDGQVVVAAGGGGIPVVKEADGSLSGVEAVIDKDFASQRLAELVEADLFIVLTGVDYVFVNYNKPDQAKLEHVNVAQLEEYIKQDQFAPGSMLPKVEAAIAFVNGRPEGKAVITSLENLGALIESESGTIIQKD